MGIEKMLEDSYQGRSMDAGKKTSATTMQVGGNHYKNMKIQPIDYIQANDLGFCAGNVVKYVSRYQSKNGVEDLRKAKHYIDLLIEAEINGKD